MSNCIEKNKKKGYNQIENFKGVFIDMKREDGASIIALILVIIVLIIIAGVAFYVVFGEKGLVNKYTENNVEYNKQEIVDKLNSIVKEKYVLDFKYAQENKKNIDEIYNADSVIAYLIDKDYIEQLKDVNDNFVENQYYINPETLNSDIATNVLNENGSDSNGTKLFKIKKLDDKYMIYFVNKYGEEEELEELIMNPEV